MKIEIYNTKGGYIVDISVDDNMDMEFFPSGEEGYRPHIIEWCLENINAFFDKTEE